MVDVWMRTKDYLIKTEKDGELKGAFTQKESSVIVCSLLCCLLHTKRRNIKIKNVQKHHQSIIKVVHMKRALFQDLQM